MSSEPLILSVETATLAGTVALSQGSEIIASSEGDKNTSHSNTLLREIDHLLKRARRALTEVDLFAVATGPGSFTGLRIGIATVKGLAFTLNRSCVPVPTLEAIAHSAGVCEKVIAVLPAGRGEVFVQMFSVSTDAVTPLDDALHISPPAMLMKYSTVSDLCWIGDGAIVHRDKIEAFAEQHRITFIDINQASEVAEIWRLMSSPANLAENVAMLAWRKARNNEIQDAKDLRAIYVRPSDAELKTQSIG